MATVDGNEMNRSGERTGRRRRPSEDGRLRLEIAAQLAAARRAAGMTQVDVSDRLQRPRSWIGKLESGRRGLLFSEALELAQLYGIELAGLAPATTAGRPGRNERE